jgi:hypothetical protein
MSGLTNVMTVFLMPECHKINFKIGDIHINGHDYRKVALALASGEIQLVQSNQKGADHAAYYYENDTLVVGTAATRDLLIHEGTHAILDHYAKPRDRYESEIVAYVAQYLYLTIKGHQAKKGDVQKLKAYLLQCITNTSQCDEAVGGAALRAAHFIFEGKPVPHLALDRLRTAIYNHPKYIQGEKTCAYNGWIPGSSFNALQMKSIGGVILN